MSYNITDFDDLQIRINDGWREWYIPKFRIYMEVVEPVCYLYWTNTEKGQHNLTRMLPLDYNDVTFGLLTPTSASEVETVINSYIISALGGGTTPDLQAVTDVGSVTTNGMTADYMAFSQTPTTGPGHAQIGYVGATQALAYDFDNTSVRCNIGQQMFAFVKNAEAVTITKGQAVYLYQASGNKATVKLAYNTGDSTSAKTLGLAAEDIAANQNGLVITQGSLDGLNTGSYSPGDTLYLGSTAGSWTATKPYAPNHLVYIGVVERANAGNGQIFVRPQNGYELDEIHDVDLITSPPTNGQVLTYNGTTHLWTAQTPTTGTVTSIATSSPITGGTITSSGTIGISNAAADGTTKGAATFQASDFDDNGSGLIKLDYTNGQKATASQPGYLTSADWSTFNNKQNTLTNPVTGTGTNNEIAYFNTTGSTIGSLSTGTYPSLTELSYVKGTTSSIQTQLNAKEPTLTKGNLTESTSSVLTISGGTSSVIGTGTSIQVKQASALQSGYLSSTDWSTFNSKGSGTVTSVTGTSPIASSGGATPAISIADAVADGATKGAAAFTAADFNSASGVISIDYTNGQAASGSNKGFLTSADWTTFNGKQAALVSGTNIKTSDGVTLLGSGNQISNYTLQAMTALGSTIKAISVGCEGVIGAFGSGAALTNQRVTFTAVYLPQAATITGVKFFQVAQGNYTANNYNGVGLYTYSGGTMTLVASSTNDGNIWKGTANTWQTKAFSATYSASAGIYFIGHLYCQSAQTTAPTLAMFTNVNNNYSLFDFTNSAKLYGQVNTLTALPASQLMSGVTGYNTTTLLLLY